jgi:diacylglycerol kinase (ATP)
VLTIAGTVSEELSSSGDSKTEEDEKRSPKDKEGHEKERDKDRDEAEQIRIYDGNASLRKRFYRTVFINKNAPVSQLLEAALRAFHIADDPHQYYLVDATDKEESPPSETDDEKDGRELDVSQAVKSQITKIEGKRPALLLRYREKDPDKGYIKVYPGKVISSLASRQGVYFKYIPVEKDTPVLETVARALKRYGADEVPSEFTLVEVLLDHGVTERELE